MLAFYVVYSLIRNQFGSATVSTDARLRQRHERIIDVERDLGLSTRRRSRTLVPRPHAWFIQFWNIFYGTFHFVVTVFALVCMFRRLPAATRCGATRSPSRPRSP